MMVLTMMLFIFSTTSYSQIKYGLKAGLNVANANFEEGSYSISSDSRMGAVVGAFVNVRLTEDFGIQPELLYSMKGTEISDFDATYKLAYLSVPVMAKYYFGGLNLQAGPMFDFLLSAKEEYDGEEDDIKEYLKGMDLGLGFGLGYDLPLGLIFDARYMMGLSNINDDNESEDLDIKTKGFQITVGFAF